MLDMMLMMMVLTTTMNESGGVKVKRIRGKQEKQKNEEN